MYAIIATGGKQYKVAEGDIIKVEKLAAEEGAGGDRRAGQGLRYRGAQRGRYSEGLCAL